MIRAMVILILAGLAFLQNVSPPVANFIEANIEAINAARVRESFNDNPYVFGGMAPNPFAYEFCPERYCPKLVPNPSISPTPGPAPKPTPEPTPVPTEEPWVCPAIGDLPKKEYRDACMESCELTRQISCAGVCNKCWKESE